MKDSHLRQDVLDELDFDPAVDAKNIGVAVDDDVVTLTGHVSNLAQKLAAEAAARRVKGVHAIAQEIEVRLHGEHYRADDKIAKRALSALAWDATVPHENIKVTVQKGVVTLTGEVDWQYQKNAAEGAVFRLLGVIAVINCIAIKPRARASDVKKRIEDALKRHAEIEAKAIRVSVLDDNVTLEGKVDNWDERQAVERAAWSAPGVRSVKDRLTIAA
jgi:osmotically-inducible protein OsmY